MIDEDYSSYNCGTVSAFKLPTFSEETSSSLVQTIKLDGQIVAFACNEYIPNINHEDRVTVIYPARNNQPCFNMGFFVGAPGHKPARVAWEGTDVAVQEYADMDFGASKMLYLRGSSIYPKEPEGTTSFTAQNDEYKLHDMSGNSYATVKIFNNIWTREDYRCTESRTGGNDKIEYVTGKDNHLYYPISTVQKSYFAPLGWRVPTSDDYRKIESKLRNNSVDRPGEAFWKGGRLGYDAYIEGYWEGSVDAIVYIPGQADHLTLDFHHARIQKGGVFTIGSWGWEKRPLAMRLIKQF